MTKKIDYEPTTEDKLADEIIKNKNLNETIGIKSLEVNHFRDDGEKQARDNKDLGEQLQGARSQREEFKVQAEEWQRKADAFEKGLNLASGENNILKAQINDLHKTAKDTLTVKISEIRTGLLFKEFLYRFFHK